MTKIAFIGAGNMGTAIIKGLLKSGICKENQLIICDNRPEILADLKKQFPRIATSLDNKEALDAPILILALKPQVIEKVVDSLANDVSPYTVIVSIAAGITLRSLQEWFNGHKKIVRAMPNTPALVSSGITALCPAADVTETELEQVRPIFEAVGQTVNIPEHLMDAYTALAGSSPAWVFMFIEALCDAAVREGLPRMESYRIAAQAVLGSAKLLLETKSHPGELKDAVCSPGGTTIEAVAALEQAGFRSAVMQAVSECTRRGKELGGQ